MKRLIGLCCAGVILLAGCRGVAVKPTDQANEQAYLERVGVMETWAAWGLRGKISLDDGEDGGSGNLSWSVEPGQSELDFRAALGRGAWNLRIRPGLAVLTEANGDRQVAPDLDTLMQERIGWPVPVEALEWWVRGVAAPGPVDDREIDESGLLVRLEQFGWKVAYDRYTRKEMTPMPRKLNATKQEYRVKLAISQWRLPENDASPE